MSDYEREYGSRAFRIVREDQRSECMIDNGPKAKKAKRLFRQNPYRGTEMEVKNTQRYEKMLKAFGIEVEE